MNDLDTTKLTDALRGLADAGPAPDHDSAWAAITREVVAANRRTRLARLAAAAAVPLAGAAAVGTLILLGSLDRDQAVEVGPVGPGSTTSAPGQGPVTTTSLGAALPEATLLVTSEDGTVLQVLDATGAVVATPVTVPGGQIFDAAITADGTVYFRASDAYGGPSEVRRTTWDGSGGSTVVDAVPAGSSGLALNPAGTLLAFSLGTAEGDGASQIGFYDITNGEVSYLAWDADELADRRTGGIEVRDFSPDGSQLAFSAAQDSLDPIESFVVDVGGRSLSDARSLGLHVAVQGWMPDGSLVGMRDVALGEPSPLVYLEGGPDVGLPSLDGQVDSVVTGRSGLTISVWYREGLEQLLRLDASGDRWVLLSRTSGWLRAASA